MACSPEPRCSARVVSMVAMGRWTDGRAHYYATAIQGISIGILSAIAVSADVRRRPVCIREEIFPRIRRIASAAIHGGFGHQRDCHQPRLQNRIVRRGVAGSSRTDQDDLALRPEGLPDTSVLVRIPMAQARNDSSAPR